MKEKEEQLGIGNMNITSILYLYVISEKKEERFGANEIASEIGLEGSALGGGWTTLTMNTKDHPPFLLKSNMFTRRNEEGKAVSKGRLWQKNKDLDWKEVKRETQEIIKVWGGVDNVLTELKLTTK